MVALLNSDVAMMHSEATGDGMKLIEYVNNLKAPDFFVKYVPTQAICALQAGGADHELPHLRVVLEGASDLTCSGSKLLEKCLQLIGTTSAEDYRRSEIKWSISKKRREMRLPDMKYVILTVTQEAPSSEATVRGVDVAGFISFMITYEDGREVIYCYEVHIGQTWQGRGLGKKLIALVEAIGEAVGVEKSMLTVFKTNVKALGVYKNLGFTVDEFSPGPRRLRNGVVKEPSYVILSKALHR